MANPPIQKWINERPDPLPPEMDGRIAGSWAQFSIVDVCLKSQAIILENEFQRRLSEKIQELISEIPFQRSYRFFPVPRLTFKKLYEIIGVMQQKLANVPWYFAEFYFYAAYWYFWYFVDEAFGLMILHTQKQLGLEKAITLLDRFWLFGPHAYNDTRKRIFQMVFLADLAGNHMI